MPLLNVSEDAAADAPFGIVTVYAPEPERSMTTLSMLLGRLPVLQFAPAFAVSVQVPPFVLIHSTV